MREKARCCSGHVCLCMRQVYMLIRIYRGLVTFAHNHIQAPAGARQCNSTALTARIIIHDSGTACSARLPCPRRFDSSNRAGNVCVPTNQLNGMPSAARGSSSSMLAAAAAAAVANSRETNGREGAASGTRRAGVARNLRVLWH